MHPSWPFTSQRQHNRTSNHWVEDLDVCMSSLPVEHKSLGFCESKNSIEFTSENLLASSIFALHSVEWAFLTDNRARTHGSLAKLPSSCGLHPGLVHKLRLQTKLLVLQDENDEPPVFAENLYEAVIPEDTPGGTVIIAVPATGQCS